MRGPRLQEPGGQSPGTALGSCLQGSRPWDQRAGLREMSKSVAQRARSHRDSNSDRWIQSPECSPLHHGTAHRPLPCSRWARPRAAPPAQAPPPAGRAPQPPAGRLLRDARRPRTRLPAASLWFVPPHGGDEIRLGSATGQRFRASRKSTSSAGVCRVFCAEGAFPARKPSSCPLCKCPSWRCPGSSEHPEKRPWDFPGCLLPGTAGPRVEGQGTEGFPG